MFVEGGQAGELMRSHPWSSTLLGSSETWSCSLKNAVNLLLNSPCPMLLIWGSERILVYNDAASSVLPDSQPVKLGQSAQDSWPELWAKVASAVEQVFATGQSAHWEDKRFSDRPSDPHRFSVSFCALWNETGHVAGTFITITPVTTPATQPSRDSLSDRKRVEQRLAAQHAVALILAEAMELADAVPALLRSLCESLGWQLGVLWKVNRYANVLQYVNHWQADTVAVAEFMAANQQTVFPSDVGLPGRVWSSHQPLWITRIGEDENFPRAELADQAGLLSGFGFPILAGQEILGVIECFSDRIEIPDEELLQTMMAIGSQIGQFMNRTHAEDALRVERELLEAVLQQMPAGVIIAEAPSGRLLLGNQQVAAIWRHSFLQAENIDQYRDYQGFHPDGRLYQPYEWPLARSVSSGEVVIDEEIGFLRGDGTRGTILVSSSPIRNSDGVITAGVVTFNDISDRKQAEAALRESRALFESFMQHIPGCAFIKDEEGRYIYTNNIGANLVNRCVEEVIGKTDFDLVLPEFAQLFQATDREILVNNQPVEALERLLQDDGEHIWLSFKFPFTDASGRRLLAGMSFDVTEREAAKAERERLLQALDMERARLETVLRQLPVGVIIADAGSSSLVLTNEQAKQIVGYNYNQSLALDDQESIVPIMAFGATGEPYAGNDYPLMRSLRQGEIVTNEELKLLRSDGSQIFINANSAPILNQQGEIVAAVVVFQDVTEQRQAQLELARSLAAEQAAREDAEAANRIKDEFLAVLSHELRSPLNPILGWTRLLRTRKFEEQAAVRALETIERNAQLQAQLIEDLLDISRILRGKMGLNVTPVNLITVVESAVETVRLAAEAKSIRLQFTTANLQGDASVMPHRSASQTLPFQILGDAVRLQQVVWNLLSNAVKFTPTQGQINIRLEHLDDSVQIQVTDTGKGINPDFLPYVFDYFRQEDGTTTRKFGGLGLGLAIVRHMVELHGGTVKASSLGENQGATFIVRLPLPRDSHEHYDEASTLLLIEDAPSLTGIRILLVDDDADTRDLVTFSLQEAGANVTSVVSAFEALNVISDVMPDVLVSDIGMPGMDGYALIQQIRTGLEICADTPAIALTAYAGEINQQQALEAGFQLHLAKPIEPDHLIKAIATLKNVTPPSRR
ncbi:MAG TPA: PAS domain-containing protein [Crinalium sp.]|jgi:PAS domain S-box-containing protein